MDTRLLIWIIDDDLVSLYATRYRIEQSYRNARVIDFDNAETALKVYLEKIRNGEELPNILFLDLIMPGLNGWQFLNELRSIGGKQKSPDVYILSAFSNSKDRESAKDHSAILGHFNKPLSKIDMERTLMAFEADR